MVLQSSSSFRNSQQPSVCHQILASDLFFFSLSFLFLFFITLRFFRYVGHRRQSSAVISAIVMPYDSVQHAALHWHTARDNVSPNACGFEQFLHRTGLFFRCPINVYICKYLWCKFCFPLANDVGERPQTQWPCYKTLNVFTFCVVFLVILHCTEQVVIELVYLKHIHGCVSVSLCLCI